MKDFHLVVLPNGQALHLIEVDAASNGFVYAAQVEHELAVDEDENVVVPTKVEDFAANVLEHNGDFRCKMILLWCVVLCWVETEREERGARIASAHSKKLEGNKKEGGRAWGGGQRTAACSTEHRRRTFRVSGRLALSRLLHPIPSTIQNADES